MSESAPVQGDEGELHVDRMTTGIDGPQRLIERLPPDSPRIGKQERDGWATYVCISEPHTMAECPFAARPVQPPSEDEIEKAAKGIYNYDSHSTSPRWEQVVVNDAWLALAYRKKALAALSAAREGEG